MKIIKVKNYDEASNEAFKVFKEQLITKPNSVLGLATGSTPVGLYKLLVNSFNNKEISFKDITSYNLDEYVGLDAAHPETYQNFMKTNLFNHVDIDLNKTNFPGIGNDPVQACVEYNKHLEDQPVDLIILGIGSNGHIGFNEPGSSFDSVTRVVDLNESTIQDNARFFNSIEEVPKQAYSMGIKNILACKKIVLVASGANKAEAIKKLINGEYTTDVPASALQKHNDVIVVVDESAGALL